MTRWRQKAQARELQRVARTIPEYRGHETPEEAALAGYSPSMKAVVIRIEPGAYEGRVSVIVDTEPSHPMAVFCVRHDDGLWWDEGDFGPI
jgi:hypothetical protein